MLPYLSLYQQLKINTCDLIHKQHYWSLHHWVPVQAPVYDWRLWFHYLADRGHCHPRNKPEKKIHISKQANHKSMHMKTTFTNFSIFSYSQAVKSSNCDIDDFFPVEIYALRASQVLVVTMTKPEIVTFAPSPHLSCSAQSQRKLGTTFWRSNNIKWWWNGIKYDYRSW